MEIKELIGKYAIRTGPTANGDYSYTSSPIKILFADEFNIVAQDTDPFFKNHSMVLPREWIDKNWRKCPKEILDAFNIKEG